MERRLTAAQVEALLRRTAKPLPGASYQWVNDAGFGVIQPEECLAEVGPHQRTKGFGLMHLTAFRSGKGDCLLLTNTKDTARILIDGGMPVPYGEHVAPALGELRRREEEAGSRLHLPHRPDHIGGVLRMLDAEVRGACTSTRGETGTRRTRRPWCLVPRKSERSGTMPFVEQFKKQAEDIEETLAASAPILTRAEIEGLREEGLKQGALITSMREAVQVSRRIGTEQLGIPLNAQANGKLMMVRRGQAPSPSAA